MNSHELNAQQIQQLDEFLRRVDYNKITTPQYKDAHTLAAHSRIGGIVSALTEKCLIRQNVELEAKRLGMTLDQRVINSATDHIWISSKLNDDQREKITNFVNDANKIIENNIRVDNDSHRFMNLYNLQPGLPENTVYTGFVSSSN